MTDNSKKGLEWQEKPLSDNERLKADSNFLRGTILDDLEDQLTGGFRGDNFQWFASTVCMSRMTVISVRNA